MSDYNECDSLLVKASSPPPVSNSDDEFTGRTYKIRWLVLIVFFSHVLYTNIAWSNVDSIADLAECYYNVDVFWINGLSYLFFVTYVLFFVFASWFLGRFGLRWAAIVSGCLGAAGAWIRFTGAGPEHFWLLLPGQALASVPNIIEWSAPALLSAVWFPPNERALATTLVGAISPQFGILISLVLGPVIFNDPQTSSVCKGITSHDSLVFDEWQSRMYSKMFYYLLGQAIFASLLVPISFMIPDAPPIPPSVSKHVEDGLQKMTVWQSILSLLKNISFLFFLIVFGILLGVAGVLVTVYEEVLSHSGYSQYESDMSYLGLSIQLTAIVVLVAVGKWIDCTKTFYGTAVFICLVSTVLAFGVAVAILFKLNFYIVCIIFTLTGGFVAMFQGVAYEFGVEMTFPVQEGISAGLLNAMSQVIATIMTLAASAMIKESAVYVMFFLGGCLGLAFIIQIFIQPRLLRVELDSFDRKHTLMNCCNSYNDSRQIDGTSIQHVKEN